MSLSSCDFSRSFGLLRRSVGREGEREREKEGEREGGREGRKERGKEGEREGGREGRRKRGKEGEREGEREGRRERGKEGGEKEREGEWSTATLYYMLWLSTHTELLTTHNLMHENEQHKGLLLSI